jgi:hypothetical protein
MSERQDVLLRMCDVVLSLKAADKHGEHLNKIRLQKFIYLADCVRLLYALLPPRDNHVTYKHGPYDSTIQHAVDALAFRGLVHIVTIRARDGGIAAEYALTRAGFGWALQLEEAFSRRWEVIVDVAQRVNGVGWPRLTALAYAEPTFLLARAKGYGQELALTDSLSNSSAFIIATIENVLNLTARQKRSEIELVLDLFFSYLANFMQLVEERRLITDARVQRVGI